jgi:hypothetical protein
MKNIHYFMSKNKTLRILSVAGFAAIAAVVAFLWYNARLFFDESLYVEKDSYEYKLLISDSIKAIPVFKPISDTVRYHYSAGDGNKPQSDSLEYETLESRETVLDFYRQYLISQGYGLQQPESNSEENIIYGNAREDFNVYVRALPAKNEVIIYHQQIDE